jgi:hypothetical protein
MVDPTRRRNFASHLSGLNIVLETREGLEATTTRCADWLRANGFVTADTHHWFAASRNLHPIWLSRRASPFGAVAKLSGFGRNRQKSVLAANRCYG